MISFGNKIFCRHLHCMLKHFYIFTYCMWKISSNHINFEELSRNYPENIERFLQGQRAKWDDQKLKVEIKSWDDQNGALVDFYCIFRPIVGHTYRGHINSKLISPDRRCNAYLCRSAKMYFDRFIWKVLFEFRITD